MKTIQSIEKVTINVKKEDLLEDKWITYQLLSSKLAEKEKEDNMGYKSLRVRFYNSYSCNKYNTEMRAGLKLIDISNPMKSNSASLILNFERA